jgi:hypothetical protein
LDEISFEEQRVIDELVKLWQICYEPPDLLKHIRDTSKPGGRKITWFFALVRQDLCTGKGSKYTAFSASEFKQFLEDEYRRLNKEREENETRARAEREENERRARADFYALRKKMENATTREELIELGRQCAALAPYTGISFVYEKRCWNCGKRISLAIDARCPVCRCHICSSCGACFCR